MAQVKQMMKFFGTSGFFYASWKLTKYVFYTLNNVISEQHLGAFVNDYIINCLNYKERYLIFKQKQVVPSRIGVPVSNYILIIQVFTILIRLPFIIFSFHLFATGFD
uniref:Uncharacterized protein n=1 Tax=Arundo donax TaxID=35708 RepID=A0A0A9U8A7_ARUDO